MEAQVLNNNFGLESMIIVFEGTDGSGKGTQAKKLLNYFLNNKKKAVLLDFPQYNTPTGKKIKEYLNGEKKLKPFEIAKLFYNDQLAQKEKIKNYIKENNIVILDRYTLSTKVYQAANLKEPQKQELINKISNLQKNLLKEDLVIVLDLPVEKSIERILKRGRKMDIHEKDKNYLKKVHDLYINLAKKHNHPIIKCVKKDYEKNIDEIFSEVLTTIKKKMY